MERETGIEERKSQTKIKSNRKGGREEREREKEWQKVVSILKKRQEKEGVLLLTNYLTQPLVDSRNYLFRNFRNVD